MWANPTRDFTNTSTPHNIKALPSCHTSYKLSEDPKANHTMKSINAASHVFFVNLVADSFCQFLEAHPHHVYHPCRSIRGMSTPPMSVHPRYVPWSKPKSSKAHKSSHRWQTQSGSRLAAMCNAYATSSSGRSDEWIISRTNSSCHNPS